MIASALSYTTGIQQIDSTLTIIVSRFEQTFPQRVRGYYLIGSVVEQTVVGLSDIDGCIIFADSFRNEQERTQAEQLIADCARISPVRLDIMPVAEQSIDQLYPVIQVALKRGSKLLYGSDIRDSLVLPTIERYKEDVTAGARFFIARIRKQDQLTTSQIEYPDAQDRFFGYTSKSIAAWYPPEIAAGTKELVATMSRIATATIAQQTDQYVAGKQQAIALYQQLVDNRWSGFVNQVYRRCKLDWHYSIPSADSDQQELRSLCQRMLKFEQAFLE